MKHYIIAFTTTLLYVMDLKLMQLLRAEATFSVKRRISEAGSEMLDLITLKSDEVFVVHRECELKMNIRIGYQSHNLINYLLNPNNIGFITLAGEHALAVNLLGTSILFTVFITDGLTPSTNEMITPSVWYHKRIRPHFLTHVLLPAYCPKTVTDP